MTTAVLALMLAAGAPTPRLAAGGFAPVGIEPARAQFFSDYFADQLNASGRVRVVTQSEMAALLGAERQRQLLGCSAENSCLAELAGALDVAGVIIGSVAKVGEELAVQLKVVAPNGNLLGLYSKRVNSEPQVLDFLGESATNLEAKLAPQSARGSSKLWAIAVAAGAAALVASVVCWVLAGSTWSRFNAGSPLYSNFAELTTARRNAELQNQLGVAFLAVGVAFVAGGAVIGFTGVLD